MLEYSIVLFAEVLVGSQLGTGAWWGSEGLSSSTKSRYIEFNFNRIITHVYTLYLHLLYFS